MIEGHISIFTQDWKSLEVRVSSVYTLLPLAWVHKTQAATTALCLGMCCCFWYPWEVWLEIYLNWFPSGKSLGCDNPNPHWPVGFKYNALQTVFQRKEILYYWQLLIKIIWFSQSISLRWKWRDLSDGCFHQRGSKFEYPSLSFCVGSCILWCIWNQNSVREKEECQRSGFAHADLLQLCRDIFRGTRSTF